MTRFTTICSRERKRFVCSCECLVLRIDQQGNLIAPWSREYSIFNRLMFNILPKVPLMNDQNVLIRSINLYGPKLVLICKVPAHGEYSEQQITNLFKMLNGQDALFAKIKRQGIVSDVVRDLFNNLGKRKFRIRACYIEYVGHSPQSFKRFSNCKGCDIYLDTDSLF